MLTASSTASTLAVLIRARAPEVVRCAVAALATLAQTPQKGQPHANCEYPDGRGGGVFAPSAYAAQLFEPAAGLPRALTARYTFFTQL